MRNVLLKGVNWENLLGAALAEDVEQVGLARLQRPACHLQVVVAEGNDLCLLPLEVKHVDRGLMQRGDIMWRDKAVIFF